MVFVTFPSSHVKHHELRVIILILPVLVASPPPVTSPCPQIAYTISLPTEGQEEVGGAGAEGEQGGEGAHPGAINRLVLEQHPGLTVAVGAASGPGLPEVVDRAVRQLRVGGSAKFRWGFREAGACGAGGYRRGWGMCRAWVRRAVRGKRLCGEGPLGVQVLTLILALLDAVWWCRRARDKAGCWREAAFYEVHWLAA